MHNYLLTSFFIFQLMDPQGLCAEMHRVSAIVFSKLQILFAPMVATMDKNDC